MKHLSLDSLISLLLCVREDMRAAKDLIGEMMPHCTSEELKMALDMRREVHEERRMLLDEISKKGGYKAYDYAAHTLCPFFT